MSHQTNTDQANTGLPISCNKEQKELQRPQYGSQAKPDSLAAAYQKIYDKEES